MTRDRNFAVFFRWDLIDRVVPIRHGPVGQRHLLPTAVRAAADVPNRGYGLLLPCAARVLLSGTSLVGLPPMLLSAVARSFVPLRWHAYGTLVARLRHACGALVARL